MISASFPRCQSQCWETGDTGEGEPRAAHRNLLGARAAMTAGSDDQCTLGPFNCGQFPKTLQGAVERRKRIEEDDFIPFNVMNVPVCAPLWINVEILHAHTLSLCLLQPAHGNRPTKSGDRRALPKLRGPGGGADPARQRRRHRRRTRSAGAWGTRTPAMGDCLNKVILEKSSIRVRVPGRSLLQQPPVPHPAHGEPMSGSPQFPEYDAVPLSAGVGPAPRGVFLTSGILAVVSALIVVLMGMAFFLGLLLGRSSQP